MRRFWLALVIVACAGFSSSVAAGDVSLHTFEEPIDALSVQLSSSNARAEVSALIDGRWGEWQVFTVDDEQQPGLLESTLITFSAETSRIRMRGDTPVALHPIRISHAPLRYEVAAAGSTTTPRILRRREWGADDSLLLRTESPPSSSNRGGGDDNGGTANLSERERQCEQMQMDYPTEFKTSPATARDENGNLLRWQRTYSNAVKLLVIHHTAQSLKSETRSGKEMMEALYKYHASNRGWGDIGYHYVVDQDGQIYEGKSGGDFVVGGHAYCNNIGTISIALIGNFDEAAPAQSQAASLQWLLKTLSERYEMDVQTAVTYHGQTLSPIVAHRDLLKTDCPGFSLYGALAQIRDHVRTGDVLAAVSFPKTAAAAQRTPPSRVARAPVGFSAVGETAIEGRPGGDVIIPIMFRAGKAYRKGASIGTIRRSEPAIGLWQEKDGSYARTRAILTAPVALSANESTMLRLKVRFPLKRGAFGLNIGDMRYTFTAAGRTARTTQTTSSYQDLTPPVASVPTANAASPTTSTASPTIRIRLTDSMAFDSVTLAAAGGATVNGTSIPGREIFLRASGNRCQASEERRSIDGDVVRIIPADGHVTLLSWKERFNRYRGTIECRVVDGQLVLINELPLEDYLLGLGEEPDTEHPEKQKTFAIAARTYAAWYRDPRYRKFPGKPYDGSDSAAEFQLYYGLVFEEANPRWTQAVRATSNEVLTYNDQLIKPPYFSQSDGRTRSPAEAGWTNFPFAEIYAPKDDPWCAGMTRRGHGVGMSGCGAEAQAEEGKTYQAILQYYYPETTITQLPS